MPQPNQSPFIVSHLRTAQPSVKFRSGVVCDGLPRPWAGFCLVPLQLCGNLRVYGFPFSSCSQAPANVDGVNIPSLATGELAFCSCNSLQHRYIGHVESHSKKRQLRRKPGLI